MDGRVDSEHQAMVHEEPPLPVDTDQRNGVVTDRKAKVAIRQIYFEQLRVVS